MTDDQNDYSSPEDFGHGITSPPTENPPSDELVHSKVPLGPWLSESFTFYGRYFWRRLLWLGLICGFFTALTAFLVLKAGGPPPTIEISPNASDAETQAAVEKYGIAVKDYQARMTKSPFFGIALGIGFLGGIFQLMLAAWSIRTIQTGNDSWRHLRLASVWTIPKIILGGICLNLLMVLVMIGLEGLIGALTALKFPQEAEQAISVFFIFLVMIYFMVRYYPYFFFILDRNLGPIASLKASARFTKKNGLTLFFGGVIAAFLAWTAIMIFIMMAAIPIAFFVGAQSATDPAAAVTTGMAYTNRFTSPTVMMIPQTLAAILITPFIWELFSVFYLMMTGQQRPGVWPREIEEK